MSSSNISPGGSGGTIKRVVRPQSSMKTRLKRREFQNRLLPIGGHASESMTFRAWRNRQRNETGATFSAARKHPSEVSYTLETGCDKSSSRRNRRIYSAPGARRTRCYADGRCALDPRRDDPQDAEYARTHPEVPPGEYAMLTIRDTGDGSNAANLKALKPGRKSARVGRSDSPPAMMSLISSAGTFVLGHAHETVIKMTYPGIRQDQHAAKQPSATTRDIRFATCPRAGRRCERMCNRLKTDFENDLAHAGIWFRSTPSLSRSAHARDSR